MFLYGWVGWGGVAVLVLDVHGRLVCTGGVGWSSCARGCLWQAVCSRREAEGRARALVPLHPCRHPSPPALRPLLYACRFALRDNPAEVLTLMCPLPPPAEWDEGLRARLALLTARGLRPQLHLPSADLLAPSDGAATKRGKAAKAAPAAGGAAGGGTSDADLPEGVLRTLEVFVLSPAEVAAELEAAASDGGAPGSGGGSGGAPGGGGRGSGVSEEDASGQRMAVLTTLVRLLEVKVLEQEGQEGEPGCGGRWWCGLRAGPGWLHDRKWREGDGRGGDVAASAASCAWCPRSFSPSPPPATRHRLACCPCGAACVCCIRPIPLPCHPNSRPLARAPAPGHRLQAPVRWRATSCLRALGMRCSLGTSGTRCCIAWGKRRWPEPTWRMPSACCSGRWRTWRGCRARRRGAFLWRL